MNPLLLYAPQIEGVSKYLRALAKWLLVYFSTLDLHELPVYSMLPQTFSNLFISFCYFSVDRSFQVIHPNLFEILFQSILLWGKSIPIELGLAM